MSAVLKISKGLETTVDNDVAGWASKYRWFATKGKNTFYVARNQSRTLGRKRFFLHNEILPPTPGLEVDHVDGNGLNNLRSNLRLLTHAANLMAFHTPQKHKTSRFRGVSFDTSRKQWSASGVLSGRRKFLGRFAREEDAARARDSFVSQHYGPTAQRNLPAIPPV